MDIDGNGKSMGAVVRHSMVGEGVLIRVVGFGLPGAVTFKHGKEEQYQLA